MKQLYTCLVNKNNYRKRGYLIGSRFFCVTSMKKENIKSINLENIWYIKSPPNVLQPICENPRDMT